MEPEETRETQAIRGLYEGWGEVLETKGKEGVIDERTKAYLFIYKRDWDPDSKFTGDGVDILEIDGPLEGYAHLFPGFKTEEDEKWIRIMINPRDPYHPKLARFRHGLNIHFFTEELNVYLSSNGRGFEHSYWGQVLPPGFHQPEHPHVVYLKEVPSSEITTELDDDPDQDREKIEPFQALKGQTFERLDILLEKVQTGENIV